MYISRATKQDLPAIQELMKLYSDKEIEVTEHHLNKKDIALQVRDDSGKLVAFAWAGLMAANTLVYIDKVVCDPNHAKQGVIKKLYLELFRLAVKRGAKEGFGIIRQDKYHDAACINALKMAFGADQVGYTYVSGNSNRILSELSKVEA